MDASLLQRLREVDTPPVCNAIEVAQGRRGFANFTRGTMCCSAPDEGAVVGYALTAQIAGLEPPTELPEVLKRRRMDYYRYMAEGARPGVAVLEDLDYPHCVSAYWGEINTIVHKGFGLAGALIHADRHGALVVPREVIPSIEAALLKMMANEQLVLGPAREPGFDFDAFAEAWAEFEAART